MTAPLRASDPIVVNVALGERSYDILIGRGQLASLGQKIAALRPGAKVAIVTDETVMRHHLAAAEAALAAAGIAATSVTVPRGRELEEFSGARARLRSADRRARRACGSRRRARRRRHRRSRRLCGRHSPPRSRLCAGADDAAGAGRFLGRRQDRDRFQPRQELDRRLSSAGPGPRRYGAARYAAAARIPRRLCRGGEIRIDRRRRLLRLAGSQLARRVRRRAGARACHCGELPHEGGDRQPRRAGDRRAGAAQSRPYLRPRARGGGRVLRSAAARRGDFARHGAGVSIFGTARVDAA